MVPYRTMHYMAKQEQSQQWKAPQLDPSQQEALVKLSQHMGHGMDEFDMEVGNELDRLVHERNYKKMQAAQRGGDLGPEQFEQEQVQQAGALQRQAGTMGQQQAAQAQATETSAAPPPAPTGTAGVTTPYPAQRTPGAISTTGKGPSGASQAPEDSEQESPG